MFDLPGISLGLRALVGAIVWGFANVIYVDLKRKGVKNFARFVAFWLGMPTTWISLFLVREGWRARFDPAEDDEQALLAEIRRDRASRVTKEHGNTPTPPAAGRATEN